MDVSVHQRESDAIPFSTPTTKPFDARVIVVVTVYYGLFGCVIGLVTIALLKDRSKQPLM
ncbi:hypothetical protein [Paraburkholderia sp. HD33-4]|uniref:hypothetical protein n=1 Tax=Paraburkholderia sp. HD33-4 TaxID=2883242 RepID=UPI001F2217DE|nr:hypothetical protein [Paraburkholderia sp. HD33-4]